MAELTIALFPLPDVVFFPETVLPLHVFEPRYRAMVADALAGDRRLAVVRLRPGWEKDYEGRPPIHRVAGAGEIVQAERLADGRYNILLDGRMRVRIEEEEPADGRAYRTARATVLADQAPHPADRRFAQRLADLRAVHARLLVSLGQMHADAIGRMTVAGLGPGAVVDRIVSAVVPDAGVRQRVLETLDLGERLDLALSAVSDLLALVAGAQEEESDDA